MKTFKQLTEEFSAVDKKKAIALLKKHKFKKVPTKGPLLYGAKAKEVEEYVHKESHIRARILGSSAYMTWDISWANGAPGGVAGSDLKQFTYEIDERIKSWMEDEDEDD